MICVGCRRAPAEIDEYKVAARAEGISPEEYVMAEEGTYNQMNGHFWCTKCYVVVGMPDGVAP